MTALGATHPLARHIGDFVTDLGNANASAQTIRVAPTSAQCGDHQDKADLLDKLRGTR